MQHNKTINNVRFTHWEKASLSLSFSRYCKRYVSMRIVLTLALFFSFGSLACELTGDYQKARIHVRAELYKEYKSCKKAANSDAFYKAVAVCKKEGRGKDIGGGCFHVVGYELVTTDKLTEHCEIFKPTNDDLDAYLAYHVKENTIEKCKLD
jgi:hypothetical protein